MKVEALEREFRYNGGLRLPDPNPNLTVGGSDQPIRHYLSRDHDCGLRGSVGYRKQAGVPTDACDQNPGCICFFLPPGLSSLFPLKSASSRDPPAIGGVGIFFWNFVCGRRVCAFKVG